jgi:nitrogen fixation protein NifX
MTNKEQRNEKDKRRHKTFDRIFIKGRYGNSKILRRQQYILRRRMKVAFATTDGINVDEHFGRAGMFVIYELMQDGYVFLEKRKFADGRDAEIEGTKDMGQIHDDRVRMKVDKLEDCKIIYLTEIGGPSAARLVKKGIMPIKIKETTSIEESMHKLFETVKTSPPPWLRKAMNSN